MTIHTDQGPEKCCGSYKTGPIIRLFKQFTIECSAIFLHVAVEICIGARWSRAQDVTMAIRRTPVSKFRV